MAGIGFKLQKLLQSDSYIAKISAYIHGAFISCGPWIMSIFVIVSLGLFQGENLSFEELELFRIGIVYCYVGSLVLFGIYQMPLTRYLADLLYTENFEQYLPTYVSSLMITCALSACISVPTCFFMNDWPLLYQWHAFMLFQTVICVWVAMTFISAAKDYYYVSYGFISGGFISIFGGVLLGKFWGLNGYMMGYTLGQLFILFILTGRIMVEFPSKFNLHAKFVGYIKKFPLLIGIGFFYNLALWLDKLMFWFDPNVGQVVNNFLHASFIYDQPIFLAYITIIPTFTIFLVKMETNFYQYYQQYYTCITDKKKFKEIMAYKDDMIANSIENTWFVIKVQSVVSLLAILCAPILMDVLKIDWFQMVVFRLCIVAAFLQGLFLILMIYLLYFDFQKETFSLVMAFFVMNLVFTKVSLVLGFPFYGMGFLFACLGTLLLGVATLIYKLNRLEYITFMKQPF